MKIARFQSAQNVPQKARGGVVAIGNFDGVHRGHQSVLGKAIEIARAENCPATTLTFEPHPRSFFNPASPVFRLTDADIKSDLLAQIGFDGVYECRFDEQLSSKSAEDFVSETLVDALDAKHVVIGYDFHFGKGRQGNPDFLQKHADSFGFQTHVVDRFNDEGGNVVSSTQIRDCLANGELAQANGLLGYSYRVHGKVVKGQQLGRTLGFPTANIALAEENEIKFGVYAVRVGLSSGKILNGVASYGRRPTFDNGAAILETHILDFDEDIYDQELLIYFESFLRGEEKFDDAAALTEQMNKDREEAIQCLSMIGPQEGLYPVVAC